MKNLLCILLFAVLALVSCKNEKAATDNHTTKTEKPAVLKGKEYTLVPFEKSTEYNDAKINGYSYENGTFTFDVSNYELGQQTPDAAQKMCANSGKGQHIHLIVDKEPYAAKYTSTFEHKVADGEHALLAFLGRSYHESIKSKGAGIAKQITVKDSTIISEKTITEPRLFYSRPKGTYVGNDAKRVMLDYYLVNVKPEDGLKVRAKINGEVFIFDEWQPYYIEGLPYGHNVVSLSLLDKDGNDFPTPLTPVTRQFTLKESVEPAE